MPLVERLVLEDLRALREANERRWHQPLQRAVERVQGSAAVGWEDPTPRERDDPGPVEGRGLGEVVRGSENGGGGTGTGVRGERQTLASWLSPRRVIESIVARRYTPDLIAASSISTDAARLAALWTTFHAEVDLESSPTDLTLVLAFLQHIVDSPSPSLPLALKVLESLLDSDENVSLAAAPLLPLLPAPAKVKFVVLRTLVALATSAQLFPTAHAALLALANLRAEHNVARGEEPADLELLHDTIDRLTDSLREARQVEYEPRALEPDHPLVVAHSLAIDLLPAWTPLPTSPTLDPTTSRLLSLYTDEAAARVRWDLVARTVETWGPRPRRVAVRGPPTTPTGWRLERHHLKLLRWYSGEAPFSAYGVLEGAPGAAADHRRHRSRSRRIAQPTRAYDLAIAASHSFVQTPALLTDWSNFDKSNWIELLSDSRVASHRTRSLARRFHTLFVSTATPSSPFLLTPRALLTLVRVSCAPIGKSHAFATSLVASRVALLSSPSSPFSAPTFDHYDLTTLAQAYLLLDDQKSMVAVYDRLLQQRIVPTQADVDVILRAAIRRHPGFVRWHLAQLYKVGVTITPETFSLLYRDTRTRVANPQKRKVALDRLVALASKLGIPISNPALLLHPSSTRTLAHPEVNKEMPLSHSNSLLEHAFEQGNWVRANRLYTSSLASGLVLEDSFRRLVNLLTPSPSTPTETREAMRNLAKGIIQDAMERDPPLVEKQATYDALLRSLMEMVDWEAVGRVESRLSVYGVRPSEDMRRRVVEWAERRGFLKVQSSQ
ncbi:hypothetical protein RQP46_002341 [Phenoliferia psychrophenolica]